MPAWGEIGGGPLTDEDITDITLWILANQDDEAIAEAASAADLDGEALYTNNCMKCHGGADGADNDGRPAPSLLNVFERHSAESILGILQNGIKVPGKTIMPPWQNGYMYEDARYDDAALERIIDYIQSEQPDPEVEQAGAPTPAGA
jgi:mono/diheme cytochrome c family protein